MDLKSDKDGQAMRTTTQRGYGARHKQLRNHYRPLVAAGKVNCWRCGQKIQPTDKWDLGHDDHDRSIYRGPEHANTCNRSAAGRKAARTRNAPRPVPDTTREW